MSTDWSYEYLICICTYTYDPTRAYNHDPLNLKTKIKEDVSTFGVG